MVNPGRGPRTQPQQRHARPGPRDGRVEGRLPHVHDALEVRRAELEDDRDVRPAREVRHVLRHVIDADELPQAPDLPQQTLGDALAVVALRARHARQPRELDRHARLRQPAEALVDVAEGAAAHVPS